MAANNMSNLHQTASNADLQLQLFGEISNTLLISLNNHTCQICPVTIDSSMY